MEVSDTCMVWVGHVLKITACITLRHVFVDLRHCVQWLVDVSNVVDYETEGKAPLIVDVTEALLSLLHIDRVIYRLVSFQEASQVDQSVEDCLVRGLKIWEVRSIPTFIVVWLIDKVPVALPGVAVAFYVIGKASTLCEWVVAFVLGYARVATLQIAQILEGSSQSSLVVLLEQDFCLSGNYRRRDKNLSAI